MSGQGLPGALVVSLDFELHWGVRDRVTPRHPYAQNLLRGREMIPRLLDIFEEFDIAATWATVGFLFATSRHELQETRPAVLPSYVVPSLFPYDEETGEGEADDPLHFAPGLIERIGKTPRQEIATHTFSHFYCTEEGQDETSFRADIEAARAIAERRGVRLRSIVFPRNQHNPLYDRILLANGITAYRGNPDCWTWRFDNGRNGRGARRRAGRLLDSYVDLTGCGTLPWAEVLQPGGLSNVRASRLLAPYRPRVRRLEPLRLQRICRCIRSAASTGEIFHLWWHPHNFGSFARENLAFLRTVLMEFLGSREHYGMLSLTMADVDDRVRQENGEALSSPGKNESGRAVEAAS